MATDPLAYAKQSGYEPRDVNARHLSLFFLVMVCFLVGVSFGLQWLFDYYGRTLKPAPVVQQPFENVRPLPPPPVLQPTPEADIQRYLQSQRDLLNEYGWVDRQNGIARIPIDRAMDLLVKKGLPVRAGKNAAAIAASAPSNAAGKNAKHPPGEVQP